MESNDMEYETSTSPMSLSFANILQMIESEVSPFLFEGYNVWIQIFVTVFLVVIIGAFVKRCFPPKESTTLGLEEELKVRFRKRDKVKFHLTKASRQMRNTASRLRESMTLQMLPGAPQYSRSGRKLRKREKMMILAKRMFGARDQPSLLLMKEPSSILLEEERDDETLQHLPEEVLYLLRSVKVFGHFEKGVFLSLCKNMETVKLSRGEYLFKIGEEDRWMYVVQEGQINMYIKDGSDEFKISEITSGEGIQSLLSVMDVLTGHPKPYRTVSAVAVTNTTVIRLPVSAFIEAFQMKKQSLVQLVQVIMTRLQRVTFLALHNYLGFSQELLRASMQYETDELSVVSKRDDEAFKSLMLKYNLSASSNSGTSNSELLKASLKQRKEDSSLLDCPRSPAEKKKQLRFDDYDVVVDDNDNVFRRQTSLPLKDACSRKSFIEDVKAASFHISNESLSASTKVEIIDEPEIMALVTDDLCRLFAIEDRSLIQEHTSLLKVESDHKLVHEGNQDVKLYFVVAGSLQVFQTERHIIEGQEPKQLTLFHAKPGMFTGQLAVLTGEPSFFGVNAIEDSIIACMTRHNFYTIMKRYPNLVLNLANTVMLRVSPFVRQIDFALDWILVEAGKSVYKQATYSDCMYIILHGRLRSVHQRDDGRKELVTEYGKGEVVGLMDALKGTPRPASLLAIRDTELAKIPAGLLKYFKQCDPGVVTRLVSMASEKFLGKMLQNRNGPRSPQQTLITPKRSLQEESRMAYGDVHSHLANLSTVAILPVSKDVPLSKFTMELSHVLADISDHVLRLSSDIVRKRLGQRVLDSAQSYRLTNWLAHHEDMNQMVLYQTDYEMTPWTQRCIRQADAVLVVALGENTPKVGEIEAQLESQSIRALKMLVLLHRPEVVRPTRTADWLNMRDWLTQHFHIKCSRKFFAYTRPSKMDEYWKKLVGKKVDRFSDFSRLARFLTGTSVALVLGGGGARGLSQLGIIKCLGEKKIPIDMIGGTSIGSFVSGLWASHRNLDECIARTRLLSKDMSAVFKKLFDITYPISSMFSGAGFNSAMHELFGDVQIEDCWIPYFTITTDITSSEMRVHTDGWLWRYVRASMSLFGFLPPLCDPKDGHLLLDGGYINNLPGDVAKSLGACKVIAVDVGSQNATDFTNYGDSLSGFWLLWKRFTGRWTGRVKVPDIDELQSRLSYISCNYLLQQVINSDYCIYVRPPIVQYKTLEFNKFEEIYNVGLAHGYKIFTEEWSTQFWEELCSNIKKRPTHYHSDEVSYTDLSSYFDRQIESYSDWLLDMSDENEDTMGYDSDGRGYESSPEFLNEIKQGGRMKRMNSLPSGMFSSANELPSSPEEEKSISDMELFPSSGVTSQSARRQSSAEGVTFTDDGLDTGSMSSPQ